MNKMDNNYSRPDGQNTGNFITDKPSSRVIHNPGGGSSICLGNADDEPRAAKHISHLKKKDIAGSGIFAAISGGSAPTAAAMSTVALPELTKRSR